MRDKFQVNEISIRVLIAAKSNELENKAINQSEPRRGKLLAAVRRLDTAATYGLNCSGYDFGVGL